MEQELEKIICKALPLPDCPMKKEAAKAMRVWLKREIIKLYGQPHPNVGPTLLK